MTRCFGMSEEEALLISPRYAYVISGQYEEKQTANQPNKQNAKRGHAWSGLVLPSEMGKSRASRSWAICKLLLSQLVKAALQDPVVRVCFPALLLSSSTKTLEELLLASSPWP